MRELLVPYRAPGPAAYRFRTVEQCLRDGVQPLDVVHELAERDVLGLKPRVRRALRERCLLLDPERLWLRSLARAAYRGTAEGVQRPPEAWLEEVVHDSIRDLVAEDVREEREMVPLCEETELDHALMTELLGVPPERARLASVRFNGLKEPVRRVAFRTLVEGWSLDRCVEEGLGTRAEVEERLRAALTDVARVEPPGPRLVDDDGELLL